MRAMRQVRAPVLRTHTRRSDGRTRNPPPPTPPRQSIIDGSFPRFVLRFLAQQFPGPNKPVPAWVRESLAVAGIAVPDAFPPSEEAEATTPPTPTLPS